MSFSEAWKQTRWDHERTTALLAHNCSFFKTLMQAVERGLFAASAEPFLAKTLPSFWGQVRCPTHSWASNQPSSPCPHSCWNSPPPGLCPSQRCCSSCRAEQDGDGGLISRAEQLWAVLFSHFRTPHQPSLSAGKIPCSGWHKPWEQGGGQTMPRGHPARAGTSSRFTILAAAYPWLKWKQIPSRNKISKNICGQKPKSKDNSPASWNLLL